MRRPLIALGLVPLLGPPLFLGGLIAVDTLAGEGLFLYQLGYERRVLVTQFVSDLISALPLAYVVAAVLVGVGIAAQRVAGVARIRPLMIAAGAVVGMGIGTFLAGTPGDPSAWALALSGLLFAAVVSLPLVRVLEAREQARTSE